MPPLCRTCSLEKLSTIFMIQINSVDNENPLKSDSACCFVIGPNSYKLASKEFGILLQVN